MLSLKAAKLLSSNFIASFKASITEVPALFAASTASCAEDCIPSDKPAITF